VPLAKTEFEFEFACRDRAEGPLHVTLDVGASIEEMLTAIGVPTDEEIRGEITVGLNGDLGWRDSVLNDADDILLFSPMAGG
jgi:molybdopterin converting factor small subunit